MVQIKVCQADPRVLDIYDFGAALKFELVLTGYVILLIRKFQTWNVCCLFAVSPTLTWDRFG